MAQALVHTQGVVLGNYYLILEVSYYDIFGYKAHFLINSPINYSKIRRLYPHTRPDVIVTQTDGIPYSDVLNFLKERSDLVFGYKGNGYQSKILDDANLTKRINLHHLPKLTRTIGTPCLWHKGISKCSEMALQEMLSHLIAPI